jgi:hypothetical protein
MSETLDTTAYSEEAVVEKVETTTEAKATKTKTKEKTLKGKFLVSPTGKFNLGYNAGEEASLPELQALELEEAGYFKIEK